MGSSGRRARVHWNPEAQIQASAEPGGRAVKSPKLARAKRPACPPAEGGVVDSAELTPGTPHPSPHTSAEESPPSNAQGLPLVAPTANEGMTPASPEASLDAEVAKMADLAKETSLGRCRPYSTTAGRSLPCPSVPSSSDGGACRPHSAQAGSAALQPSEAVQDGPLMIQCAAEDRAAAADRSRQLASILALVAGMLPDVAIAQDGCRPEQPSQLPYHPDEQTVVGAPAGLPTLHQAGRSSSIRIRRASWGCAQGASTPQLGGRHISPLGMNGQQQEGSNSRRQQPGENSQQEGSNSRGQQLGADSQRGGSNSSRGQQLGENSLQEVPRSFIMEGNVGEAGQQRHSEGEGADGAASVAVPSSPAPWPKESSRPGTVSSELLSGVPLSTKDQGSGPIEGWPSSGASAAAPSSGLRRPPSPGGAKAWQLGLVHQQDLGLQQLQTCGPTAEGCDAPQRAASTGLQGTPAYQFNLSGTPVEVFSGYVGAVKGHGIRLAFRAHPRLYKSRCSPGSCFLLLPRMDADDGASGSGSPMPPFSWKGMGTLSGAPQRLIGGSSGRQQLQQLGHPGALRVSGMQRQLRQPGHQGKLGRVGGVSFGLRVSGMLRSIRLYPSTAIKSPLPQCMRWRLRHWSRSWRGHQRAAAAAAAAAASARARMQRYNRIRSGLPAAGPVGFSSAPMLLPCWLGLLPPISGHQQQQRMQSRQCLGLGLDEEHCPLAMSPSCSATRGRGGSSWLPAVRAPSSAGLPPLSYDRQPTPRNSLTSSLPPIGRPISPLSPALPDDPQPRAAVTAVTAVPLAKVPWSPATSVDAAPQYQLPVSLSCPLPMMPAAVDGILKQHANTMQQMRRQGSPPLSPTGNCHSYHSLGILLRRSTSPMPAWQQVGTCNSAPRIAVCLAIHECR